MARYAMVMGSNPGRVLVVGVFQWLGVSLIWLGIVWSLISFWWIGFYRDDGEPKTMGWRSWLGPCCVVKRLILRVMVGFIGGGLGSGCRRLLPCGGELIEFPSVAVKGMKTLVSAGLVTKLLSMRRRSVGFGLDQLFGPVCSVCDGEVVIGGLAGGCEADDGDLEGGDAAALLSRWWLLVNLVGSGLAFGGFGPARVYKLRVGSNFFWASSLIWDWLHWVFMAHVRT